MPTITAVIPAYNEAARIARTVDEVQPFVDEIIVVDDASDDDTAAVASKHGATVFTQTRNRGYIAAIKSGFGKAHGDIVVTLDADGEFAARDIPKLVRPIIQDQADMVQGHRNLTPRLSEQLLTWMAQKKAAVGDSGTGLRALRTSLATTLDIRGACICGVLALEVAAKGGRITEIPITLKPVDKPRTIAWFHVRQFFYLLPWLYRKFEKTG